MASYYNIFKDTEFTIQNTDSNVNINKLFKSSYQNGGNINDLIYEDMDISKQQFSKQELNKDKTKNKFRKSCQQPIIQNFKQPMIQIGGFYIQL